MPFPMPGRGRNHFVVPGQQLDPGLWWVHLLIWIAVIALLAVGFVLLIRALSHRHTGYHHAAGSTALHELDLRYARGDVERSDYLERRADLLGYQGAGVGSFSAPPPPVAPPPVVPPSPTAETPPKKSSSK